MLSSSFEILYSSSMRTQSVERHPEIFNRPQPTAARPLTLLRTSFGAVGFKTLAMSSCGGHGGHGEEAERRDAPGGMPPGSGGRRVTASRALPTRALSCAGGSGAYGTAILSKYSTLGPLSIGLNGFARAQAAPVA